MAVYTDKTLLKGLFPTGAVLSSTNMGSLIDSMALESEIGGGGGSLPVAAASVITVSDIHLNSTDLSISTTLPYTDVIIASGAKTTLMDIASFQIATPSEPTLLPNGDNVIDITGDYIFPNGVDADVTIIITDINDIGWAFPGILSAASGATDLTITFDINGSAITVASLTIQPSLMFI